MQAGLTGTIFYSRISATELIVADKRDQLAIEDFIAHYTISGHWYQGINLLIDHTLSQGLTMDALIAAAIEHI